MIDYDFSKVIKEIESVPRCTRCPCSTRITWDSSLLKEGILEIFVICADIDCKPRKTLKTLRVDMSLRENEQRIKDLGQIVTHMHASKL
jgi:hypothetical protein